MSYKLTCVVNRFDAYKASVIAVILSRQNGELGFEPRFEASKAPVLPLDDSPMMCSIAGVLSLDDHLSNPRHSMYARDDASGSLNGITR